MGIVSPRDRSPKSQVWVHFSRCGSCPANPSRATRPPWVWLVLPETFISRSGGKSKRSRRGVRIMRHLPVSPRSSGPPASFLVLLLAPPSRACFSHLLSPTAHLRLILPSSLPTCSTVLAFLFLGPFPTSASGGTAFRPRLPSHPLLPPPWSSSLSQLHVDLPSSVPTSSGGLPVLLPSWSCLLPDLPSASPTSPLPFWSFLQGPVRRTFWAPLPPVLPLLWSYVSNPLFAHYHLLQLPSFLLPLHVLILFAWSTGSLFFFI